jgi:hypothetical protein
MTPVEKYISDLLHFHDCVIVPGLGGFVANYKPSAILEERSLFLPPVKEVGFNRSLSHSDGLLTDFMARREGLTYAEASVQLERFVARIHEQISSGQVIDLGEVGSLKKDAIGNLQFTPKSVSSFLPEALGLGAFHFEPLEQRRMPRIDVENHVPGLLRSRSPRYWAAAAALIAGLFLFNTELKMPTVNQAAIGMWAYAPVVEAETPVQKEVETETAYVMEAMEISENDVLLEEDLQVPASEPLRYHIIVASFKQPVPANEALDNYIGKGFSNARLVDDGQGRIRVAVSSFADKQSAIDALPAIRQTPGFSGAWVYTSK